MLQLINREDYIGKDHNEVMEEFQKIVDGYEADIKDMDLEQCREEEKRLIAIMDEHDKIMLGVEYDLPKVCKFMGSKDITRKAIGNYICELLGKVDVGLCHTPAPIGISEGVIGGGKLPFDDLLHDLYVLIIDDIVVVRIPVHGQFGFDLLRILSATQCEVCGDTRDHHNGDHCYRDYLLLIHILTRILHPMV